MTNLGYTPQIPVCAIATALAPSALGVVRASGTDCISLVAKFFSRPKALLSAQGYTLVHGWLLDADGLRVDEVMVAVYKAPRSFTGEDMVEVFCHGGVAVVRAVHALFLNNGFTQAQRGEFTFRAFINGKTDLTRAEAVREIIDSKTDASRSRAAGRLAGSVRDEIADVKKQIVDTLATIEVEIEYPEDEETIADSFDVSALKAIQNRLTRLVQSWKSERLYQDGLRVVLCGPTNAGKSSLFNVLLKEERAIVSDVAGTTRDWIEGWASFDGIPVRLFDTAGLRDTSDVVEAAGIERTKDIGEEADVMLYVVDSSVGMTAEDKTFVSNAKVPVVLVYNKCDVKSAAEPDVLKVSAKQNIGIDELVRKVVQLSGAGTQSAADTEAGLGSDRQREAVQEALDRVTHALEVSSQSYSLDAVVQDLEDSLDSLGEITGEVVADDILESIFSNFCVGK